MAKTTKKQVTISFFELLLAPDGVRVPERKWQGALNNIAALGAVSLEYRDGRLLVGAVIGGQKRKGVSLSIDRIMNPRERQEDTGECKTMETSGVGFTPAEETIVVFFERNVFGILQSAQGAPSHSAVASWLNKVCPPNGFNDGKRWKASPIVRKDIYNSVIRAKDMKVTETTFKVEPRELADADFGVFDSLYNLFGAHEDGFAVSITMQAGPKRNNANIQTIRETVEKVLEDKEHAQKLSVKAKPEDGPQRAFNLLEDRVTHKIAVDKTIFDGADGRFQEEAISEITEAYNLLKDVLLERVPSGKNDSGIDDHVGTYA